MYTTLHQPNQYIIVLMTHMLVSSNLNLWSQITSCLFAAAEAFNFQQFQWSTYTELSSMLRFVNEYTHGPWSMRQTHLIKLDQTQIDPSFLVSWQQLSNNPIQTLINQPTGHYMAKPYLTKRQYLKGQKNVSYQATA